MTTSLALIALSSVLASNRGAEQPTWLADYTAARQFARSLQRPLAVVVGSGQEGWDKLSHDGKLASEVNKLLAANYVCVYVNITEGKGLALAAALELSSGTGLVISDRSGQTQAFHHEGGLSQETLTNQLRRFADPQRVVRHTETLPVQRTSFYPPSFPPTYQPTFYPAVSGGRNC